MVTLIIKSANNNKYGDLKRLLINITTHGQNCYPTSKADTYTMLCKFFPKITKNKNESTATCDRPYTGVSFYQRTTPVDGQPVERTNVTIEEMINFWQYVHRGHISPLHPNANTKYSNVCNSYLHTIYTPLI